MAETSFSVSRANPRFSFIAEAEVLGLRDDTRIVARISELSCRGCYIDTINPVAIGTELRLRIRYGGSTCEVPCKVIYTHSGYGMGVLFGEMAAGALSAIQSWLDELARKTG